MLILLLSACAAPKMETVKQPSENMSGGLLVVRIEGRFDAPAMIAVDISSSDTTGRVSMTGRLSRSIPGLYSDYLVAIGLPPKRYVLSGLREIDSAAERKTISRVFVPVNASFDVEVGFPKYLGRLILTAEPNTIVKIDDYYSEDVVLFRNSIPALQSVNIAKDIIGLGSFDAPISSRNNQKELPLQLSTALGATGRSEVDIDQNNTTNDQNSVQFVAIAQNDLKNLRPAARKGFQRYLTLPSPRAFAINESGSYGMASGNDSINQALQNCKRATNARRSISPCRLYSVDDTLIVLPN